MNVAEALLQLGDWDAAEAELTQAADSDGTGGHGGRHAASAAGSRRCVATPGRPRPCSPPCGTIRSSEDPQDQSLTSLLEAFAAAARRQPADALRHARAILAHAEAIGISSVAPRWAWPLAARCAYELGDTAAVRELLALLDSYQPGHLAPMLRAERDLVRARLAAGDGGDEAAAAAFAAAIKSLRELVHALPPRPRPARPRRVPPGQSVTRHGRREPAIAEARDLAGRLRCQPLLDRAAP